MARISKTNETRNTSGLLTSKVALVSGGSRGIGRAIAMKLAELGADVAICGRDSEKLRATADTLEGLTKRVFWQTADVTRADEVGKFVSLTETKLGPIGILVNNAGIGLFGPPHEQTQKKPNRILKPNLKTLSLISPPVCPP